MPARPLRHAMRRADPVSSGRLTPPGSARIGSNRSRPIGVGAMAWRARNRASTSASSAALGRARALAEARLGADRGAAGGPHRVRAARRRRAAPARARPRRGAVGEPDDRAPGARVARGARAWWSAASAAARSCARTARWCTTSRAWPASPSRSSARAWRPARSILEAASVPRARAGGRGARARARRVRPCGWSACGSAATGRSTLEDTWVPAVRFPGLLDARPHRLALRADARALRPRPGERDGAARAGRGALLRGRGARGRAGLAADARGADRLRRRRHRGRVRPRPPPRRRRAVRDPVVPDELLGRAR